MARESGDDETPRLAPEEVFGLLGNETRVGILQALWEGYYRYGVEAPIPFSELYERVDIDDSGNFNYHLGRLTDHLVRRTEEGYELTPSGFRLVNGMIGAVPTEDALSEPARVDATCPRCESPLEIATEEGTLWVLCTGCEGYWAQRERAVGGFQLPPEGIRPRSPDEVFHSSIAYTVGRGDIMVDGVCPDCGATADPILAVCEDHDADAGICTACGTSFLGLYTFACSTCRNAIVAPSWGPLSRHPALIAFYHERGVDHWDNTWEAMRRAYTWREELLSADPPEVRVTVTHEGETLSATVDGAATVSGVER